ncbi:MAG: HAMP domain-containing protein [Chloroflexi bacterium]|nr:HAMP domain-containing protein [Chloroflexota bacterium]
MKLGQKLFLSYLLVILVGLLILALSTAFIAPITFSQQMRHMEMNGAENGAANIGGMMNGGQGRAAAQALNEQLNSTFRASVDTALLLAGAAATLVALFVSWFVSRRIVHPLRAMAQLSQRIAGGHYEQRLTAQAQDELGDLTHNLNTMASALEQTETMRRQLLADVTHELKTPLASIKGYMEGLQDGVLPATAETFQSIHRETMRLQRLVQDLGELSRAEARQIEMHVERIAPETLARAVIQRLQPQFAEKHIALLCDLPAKLPEVCADRDRAEQILTNLLGNALQYTPADGTVTLSAVAEPKALRFSIQDTGIGLAPQDIERIFQRFYRVDKSRSRAFGGSGIGLTIARHLAEAQGGGLSAESPGLRQGSTFHFTLPAA